MLELKIVVPLENHFETEMLSVLLHYIGKTVPTNAGITDPALTGLGALGPLSVG